VGIENKTSILKSFKSEISLGLGSFLIIGNRQQWTVAPSTVLNPLHCEE
jgi:hypothetical protein